MTSAAHLEARRVAQEIARLHRHIRHLRRTGRMSEADAARAAFATERVIVVPTGNYREIVELLEETEWVRGERGGG